MMGEHLYDIDTASTAGDNSIPTDNTNHELSQHELLMQKQAMLAAIIDSSDDAIISKTLKGIITTWNRAAEKLFGYHESEVIGQHITILIPDDRRAEEDHIIGRIRAGERVDHYETIRRRKDGTPIHLSLTVSPIKNAEDKIVGASKIARDISVQKQAQEQLRLYSEKLELLNNYKDEFVGMASHELKTPLTSIQAYLQLLNMNLQDGAHKDYVGKIVRNVSKLAGLVEDLLDVSKIQAGKLQLNITPFDIGELLYETVENIQTITPSHDITFKNDLIGTLVSADRQRIEQVLINLLTNALKYSPTAKEVIVKGNRDDNKVIISIQDFGIGIPKEDLENIFSRFFRVQGLSPSFSGLGIGLYIAYEIIARHKGKMWVESTLGKGSTFYFALPL